MDSIINYQYDLNSRINKAKVNFKKSPKERLTKQYVEGRLQMIESLWVEFFSGHKELMRSSKPEVLNSSNYIKTEMYDGTEEIYLEYKGELKLLLDNFDKKEETNVAQTVIKAPQVQLPKINIPTFSGQYSEWSTFRDLFQSLVHFNKDLDNVQRLHYLKGYLTGEAEQLLRHIPIADINYNRCWSLLEERYNNKKYLSHSILKRLLSQKNCTIESAIGIKDLIDTTTECLEALSTLGIDVTTWDILIIHIISLKLDSETKRQWEFNVTNTIDFDCLPTFKQFKEFLTGRFRALEFLDTKNNKLVKCHTTNVTVDRRNVPLSCQYCAGSHRISVCKRFSAANVDARRDFVQNNSICFICLGQNHVAKHCYNSARCRICKGRHHSLLHPRGSMPSTSVNTSGIESQSNLQIHRNESNNVTESKLSTQGESISKSVVTCFSTGVSDKTVLLATALIKAESKNGKYQVIRALIDQGSQGSFITEATVQFLGLKKIPMNSVIHGVGKDKNIISKSIVKLNIQSIIDTNFKITITAYVLKSITTLLPVTQITATDWVDIDDSELADPQYYTPNKINVLLGADIYSKIIKEGLNKSTDGSLVAQSSVFGWIISGVANTTSTISSHLTVMHACIDPDDTLKMFWEMEAEPINKKKILTEDEQKCENIYQATTTRDEDGRYVVRLPFREMDPACQYGNSKRVAEKRFKSLELKLYKNEGFKKRYKEVIDEYVDLKHMIQVTEEERNNKYTVYLPHHAVIREDKTTTKLRVVFDASCKGENDVSLNDDLLVGPTLQDDLRHIIMRWRLYPICLVADIVKMYRQVKVHYDDQRYQRVMWRESSVDDMVDYQLTTVTFGTASAPFLAVRTLHQIAIDEGKDYPVAAKRVLSDFYMDDLMTGAESVDEAVEIYKQMNSLLLKGGFKLQKWSSNSNEVITAIKSVKEESLQLKVDNIIKILGLTWYRDDDAFHYSVHLPALTLPATKRNIISDIAKLYDPLGFIAPSIVLAKILIQKIWLAGIGWDEEVPNHILNEWLTYRTELQQLEKVTLPRWLNFKSNAYTVELHGFCDASKSAYAASVYLRVVDSERKIHINLLTSKTKVAPIKQVSIPRLELCGAVLLSRLMVEVASVIGLEKKNLYAWTDSEVVLAWINSHPSKWQTFVANRVSEILNTLDAHRWAHVQSKHNPADCASRGISPGGLYNHSLWFNGPEFLKEENIVFSKPKDNATDLEIIKSHTISVETEFWDKYSTFSQLIRVVGFIQRFIGNCKNPPNKRTTVKYLEYREINEAKEICIKKCQQEFLEEILNIKKNGSLNMKNSKLKSLNVFLDEKDILRVGGRLEQSSLNFNQKHPIILPKNSFITKLVVDDAHKKTLHGGLQLMLSYLNTRYWIIGVRYLIKACIRKCVTCVKNSAVTRNQLMGQLPAARVTVSKPFNQTGVDYAGPINIRLSKGRGNRAYKGYICLFICMATRAVHLEAVTDLSSQGFLAAFKRFVARRGYCADLYSDNGTNFVGAARELRQLLDVEKSQVAVDIADWLSTNGTNWHFIPPHGPNFGGLWEAGIKSTKHHLKRIIQNYTLTFEEISTVLSQIEACLNSRPLSKIYDNNSQIQFVLTPGHFLVGEPLISVPEVNYEPCRIGNLRRWQLTQRMVQDFWRRWSQEYLTQFLRRHKWSEQTPEPKVGDVVLVKEDDLPPCRWLTGIVEQKHPGSDSITRVVTLRTKNSLLKRPTSKLCILPVTD